jgi:hypothetical protein
LGLKPKSSSNISDSQNNRSSLNIYLIDTLLIGDVKFLNLPFAGADLSKIVCFGQEFDGIIGLNLMSKAIWLIDNENKKITIVDKRNKLNLMPNAEIIKFKTYKDGLYLNLNPYFNLDIPKLVNNKMVELDMGSPNGFELNKKIVERNAISASKYSIGNASQGLFGRNKIDTTFYFVTNTLKMNKMKVDEEIEVKYKGTIIPTVGMDFLKNYNIILDWKKNEITLSKIHSLTEKKIVPYGFKIGMDKSIVVVNEIFNNSDAERKGLKLGDKIIKIDEIDFQNKNTESDCAKIKQFENLSKNEINIKVEREGNQMNFVLVQN